MDYRDAPTVETLWDRTHTARKAHACNICKQKIEPGQRYQSTGARVDGVFEHWVRHLNAERYPSGCPTIGERDRREEQAQFDKDAALWNAEPVRARTTGGQ